MIYLGLILRNHVYRVVKEDVQRLDVGGLFVYI